MRRFDLAGLVAHFESLAAGIAAEERVLLDGAARLIKEEARQAIGKEGELRDSIEHVVLTSSAHVGSNMPDVEAREFGSLAIPPQSFLSGSAFRKATEVRDLIGDHFSNYLAGSNR
jgi:hypothetical protein